MTPPERPPEARPPSTGPLAAPVVPRARIVPPGLDRRPIRRITSPEATPEPEAPRRSVWTPGSLFRIVASAVFAAMFLRACVFDAYRIPSASMEQTLRPGDYVFVSKLGYGARIPEAVRLPLVDRWVANPIAPGARLPGLGRPERGDVLVFHFPPEGGPIAGKTPYVKRLIALPGESVEIQGKGVLVDGEPLAPPEAGRQYWVARLREGAFLPFDSLRAVGFSGRFERVSDRERLIEATAEVADRIRGIDGIERVLPLVRRPGDGSARFPAARRFSLDDWGPFRVPNKGWTIALDGDTWPVYRDAIVRHERASIERVPGGFMRDGAVVDSFTFSQDYYVTLGDHRDDSADSRTWGFVPTDHLIGEAKVIYFSWDPETREARWDRFLSRVR
ncbi:MAG: signal peptidase I [Bacteroidota bacterium]